MIKKSSGEKTKKIEEFLPLNQGHMSSVFIANFEGSIYQQRS